VSGSPGARGFDGKSVLVVGGAGFVGGNLVRSILAGSADVAVFVIDNLLSAERENLPSDPRVRFLEASVASGEALAEIDDRFDFIFHLATYHGNQSSIHDPIADHENNLLTTLKLLHRVRGHRRLAKFVYSSAGCGVAEKTFGVPVPTTEDAPVSLVQDSPYSISKIVGEFYSVYYHRQHGVPTVRARFQNVYGPGEILGAGRWRGTPATVWRNVTPTFVYKALKGLPLTLENGGIASRDFIFVDDICRGLLACAFHGSPGDVYNLAGGAEITIRDLADSINRLTGNRAGVEVLPGRPWDRSGRRFGSTDKARRELVFAATVGLQEGLGATIAWTRENMGLIDRCIGRHAARLAAS
jgi:nucleoside-diphosphate-sugar epimerase